MTMHSVTSASPPPGEDLAGQGEPVAWAYEVWNGTFWMPRAGHLKPESSWAIRNIEPLFKRAAPAPSRPADRAAVAEIIRSHVFKRLESPTAIDRALREAADAVIIALRDAPRDAGDRTLALGDRVRKTKGSSWQGRVCGFYRTDLTPEGVCVESEREPGSVQIYPVSALEPTPPSPTPTDGTQDTDKGGD